MTTKVPATMLAAGAAVASLGFTPGNPAAPQALKQAYTPAVAVTFHATTMALDCALSNVFTTTLTAPVTVAPVLSNPGDGQTINWFLTQDGAGNRTMTWPTSFKWPGGTPVALSSAGGSVDLLAATYRAATGFWYVSLTKAFA